MEFVERICEDFSIISNNLEDKNLRVKILYKKNIVAIVSLNQLKNLEIEFFNATNDGSWNFLLKDFLLALQFAKNLIIEQKKIYPQCLSPLRRL